MSTTEPVGAGTLAKRHRPYNNISFIEKVLSDDTEMMKLFEMWRIDHRKEYATDEEKLKRFGIFKDNAREIYDIHLETPGCSYDCHCGLNGYSDITYEEYKGYCCGVPSDSDDETCSSGGE